jgi:uncharacterized protein (DUF1810 family)
MARDDSDIYDLKRFIEAQQTDYAVALDEIKHGEKQSHWMWFIFPQVLGLGYTSTSMLYGIKDLDEAAAYLSNEILGKRLVEISNVLLALETDDARQVFGGTDAMKLRSCMTLFSLAPGADEVFQLVLDKFFNGKKDDKTLQLLGL